MLSDKRWYRKVAILLSSGIIFLLGACGDVVTEEELASEEGKGDTQTGILSKSYSNLDPQYGLASNPKIISIPERGYAKSINLAVNVSFPVRGFIVNRMNNSSWSCMVQSGSPFPVTLEIIHNGAVVAEAVTLIKGEANCLSTDICKHSGSINIRGDWSGFINGEWELRGRLPDFISESQIVDYHPHLCSDLSAIAKYMFFEGLTIKDWSLTLDYEPTLTSLHVNTKKLHLPDADKQYEAYSSIKIPQIYSGPLSGGRSGILVNVDIAHKDPKDLVIELEHNEKSVTLLELAHATQVQNGLQRRFSLSDVPELSTFAGEDMAGEWRLWLVDRARGYEGDLNWWSLELTPSASK